MLLVLINTSPKGKAGNTEIISGQFINGFLSNENNIAKQYYSRDIDKKLLTEIAILADIIIFSFPLYIYNLPAGTIKTLRLLKSVKTKNKLKVGFICQYGFPEACHARALEHLLNRFCIDLNIDNIGMMIRGGCEGIKRQSERKTKPLLNKFYMMGKHLATEGRFSRKVLNEFSKPERIGNNIMARIKSRIFMLFGNQNMWKALLKKNGALDKHWDQPLLER